MQNLFLFLAYICFIPVFSQLAVNPGADTSSIEHQEIYRFWNDYINTQPSKNTTAHISFWNEEDRKQFKQPDLVLHAINGEHSTFELGYPTLLSILPFKNNFYEIKTAVGYATENGVINIIAITKHYVKKSMKGKYELYSPLDVLHDVKLVKNEEFTIYSLKNVNVSADTINKLSSFIKQIKTDYGIKENNKITILYGRNASETDYLLGFDFNMMSSANNPAGGMADIENNAIMLKGLSPVFHETVHLFINPIYTNSPLLEGVATFYGGSMGKSLEEGIKFMNEYCEQRPTLDLYEKLVVGNFYINAHYNPNYILQGLLVREAHRKNGIEGIKKLLS